MLRKFDRSTSRATKAETEFKKILYVEDEDANWNVAELHLRDKYEIKRAKNATEAFALLGEERFNLILLDIQLAGSTHDGIEICRILKQHPLQKIPAAARSLQCQSVPIVFVTAFSERYSKEYLLEIGGDDMITKPVDFTRLTLVSSRLIIRSIQRASRGD
ncbi:MAG: response regulator [Deltaproteobacteria bacterium]|nr:response regulator [Deltaproteobacteria bacterium]